MIETRKRQLLLATLAAIAGLAVIYWLIPAGVQEPGKVSTVPPLRDFDVNSANELLQRFEKLAYSWPPQGPVPPVALESLPDDMNELRVQQKKSVFFRTLAPLIAAENAAIRQQRRFLVDAFANPESLADPGTRARIERLAIRYKVAGDIEDARFQRKLLAHVDVIPAGLIMAQAANESAWGTSRFAREANNLFGIWTWNEEKGIEPLRRDPDATHFVRIYSDLQAAVENYLYTINIGSAYEGLRLQRARLRDAGKPLDPVVLAGGLARYSERGEAYVDEIRSMIRYNKLDEIERIELRDGSDAPK